MAMVPRDIHETPTPTRAGSTSKDDDPGEAKPLLHERIGKSDKEMGAFVKRVQYILDKYYRGEGIEPEA